MRIITITIFFIMIFSCENDDDDALNDALPPITEIGANTAGCLVNGKLLIPKGNSRTFQCFYQEIQNEFYFGLSFTDKIGERRTCVINSRMREIEEGKTYVLNMNNLEDQGYGALIYFSESNNTYSTTPTVNGELTVNKLQYNPNIVSGTFWFTAIDENNDLIEVTEGRFDAQFNQ